MDRLLSEAIARGSLSAVKEQLEGAEVNTIIPSPALALAAKYGKDDIVNYLLSKEFSVNIADRNGKTPLHMACNFGHVNVVRLLASHRDIEVNACDCSGATPLMVAAKINSESIVEALLQSGACPSMRSKSGLCATDVTKKSSVRTLLEEWTNGTISPTRKRKRLLTDGSLLILESSIRTERPKCVLYGKVVSESNTEVQNRMKARTDTVSVIIKCHRDRETSEREHDFYVKLLSSTGIGMEENGPFLFPSSSFGVVGLGDSESLTSTSTIGATSSTTWHGSVFPRGLYDLHKVMNEATLMFEEGRCASTCLLRLKMSVAVDIARAVSELHRHGFVWCDTKPSNFVAFPSDQLDSTDIALKDYASTARNNAAAGASSASVSAADEDSERVGSGNNGDNEDDDHPAKDDDILSKMKLRALTTALLNRPNIVTWKAIDLGGAQRIGTSVDIEHVSCTAKYLSPEMALTLANPTIVHALEVTDAICDSHSGAYLAKGTNNVVDADLDLQSAFFDPDLDDAAQTRADDISAANHRTCAMVEHIEPVATNVDNGTTMISADTSEDSAILPRSVRELAVSTAYDCWGIGMALLHLFNQRYRSFYTEMNLNHADNILDYLRKSSTAEGAQVLQRDIDEFISSCCSSGSSSGSSSGNGEDESVQASLSEVIESDSIIFAEEITVKVFEIIRRLLRVDPAARISAQDCWEELSVLHSRIIQ